MDATPYRIAPVSAPPDPAPARGRLVLWIVKLTSILVVMPALINAGWDVYVAARKLPRTDAERTNAELFRKYFNTAPLATLPVPIESSGGTVAAQFSIYREGEIYVRYGNSSQWFAFPGGEKPRPVPLSLLSSAFAQAPAPSAGAFDASPIVSQRDVINGNRLYRSSIYQDGRTEQGAIDIRSGAIENQPYGNVARDQVPVQRSAPYVITVNPINLDQLKAARSAGR